MFKYCLPFLFFIIGYLAISRLVVVHTVEAPVLVGGSLENAVILCGQSSLSLIILTFHEDPDMAPGTIISQMPEAGSSLKAGQKMFVVVVQAPKKIKAPRCTGRESAVVKKEAQQQGIVLKEYTISDDAYPHDMIIAQMPQEGSDLYRQELLVYRNYITPDQRCVVPDLVGLSLYEVQQWCDHNRCEYDCVHNNQKNKNAELKEYRVQAQMPLAGSFIDMNTKPRFQFCLG